MVQWRSVGGGGGLKTFTTNLKLCVCVYAEHQTVTKNWGGVVWGVVMMHNSVFASSVVYSGVICNQYRGRLGGRGCLCLVLCLLVQWYIMGGGNYLSPISSCCPLYPSLAHYLLFQIPCEFNGCPLCPLFTYKNIR